MKPISIDEELLKLSPIHSRTPETEPSEVSAAFAKLGSEIKGDIFTGSFTGDSPWERHCHGNELVQILKGETEITIKDIDGKHNKLFMTAGMLVVVPNGLWHRFHAPNGVTVLTVTPGPTDHSTADDPL